MLTKLRSFDYYEWSVSFFFFIFVFILTRQIPFAQYSFLMNISLIGIFVLSLPKILIKLNNSNFVIKSFFLIHFFLLCLLLTITICFTQNEITLAFRFFLILLLISLAYFVELPFIIIKIFIILYILQSVLVILMGVLLPIFFNILTYSVVRSYINFHNWGDVFTYNGLFYRIEIVGNSLIPFVYFFTYSLESTKYIKFVRILFLVATFFAGNFAFLLSLIFFHMVYFFLTVKSNRELKKRIVLFLFVVIVSIVPLVTYFSSVMEMKKAHSLSTRVEQKDLLFADFTSSFPKSLLGSGLGNTLKVTTLNRNYEDAVYFELQGLYFLNQTGFVYFSFFVLMNIVFSIYLFRRNNLLYLIYLSYLLYSLTNPYVLDSNQITVIFLLSTLSYSSILYNSKFKYHNA